MTMLHVVNYPLDAMAVALMKR